jgi:hypothetical protein
VQIIEHVLAVVGAVAIVAVVVGIVLFARHIREHGLWL